MIKRLIFDLDNTLIIWKDEYLCALDKTMKKYNINEDANYVNDLIDKYEENFAYYDKDLLIDFINQNINDKIDINFINDFLYEIGFCGDTDDSIVDTLEYLSGKYELVVLTNWFTIPQMNRLKSAGIYKYFSNIYGGEAFLKPSSKAFIRACGNNQVSECLMIGDSYDKDVVGAYNVGIRPIYVNPKHKENKLNFDEIYTLSELKEIL